MIITPSDLPWLRQEVQDITMNLGASAQAQGQASIHMMVEQRFQEFVTKLDDIYDKLSMLEDYIDDQLKTKVDIE